MRSFKIKYHNETRRFTYNDPATAFDQLKEYIRDNIGNFKKMLLFYLDDEGDMIVFSTSTELQDAITLLEPNAVKIYVEDRLTVVHQDQVDHSDDSSFEFVDKKEEESPVINEEQKFAEEAAPVVKEEEAAPVVKAEEAVVKAEEAAPVVEDQQKEETEEENRVEQFVCVLIDFIQQDGISDVLTAFVNDIFTVFRHQPVTNESEFVSKIETLFALNEKYQTFIKDHRIYHEYFDEHLLPLLVKQRHAVQSFITQMSVFQPIITARVPNLVNILPNILAGVLDVVNDANNEDFENELNFPLVMDHIKSEITRNMMAMMGQFNVQEQQPNQQEQGNQTHAAPKPQKYSWEQRAYGSATCDECNVKIVNKRFICLHCEDYDLCEACEAKNNHDINHNFIQVDVPFKPIHRGVRCDGCDIYPIVGVRYKCGACADYDLCEKCHADGVHSVHPFIKMRVPTRPSVGPHGRRQWRHHGNSERRGCPWKEGFRGRGGGRCGVFSGGNRSPPFLNKWSTYMSSAKNETNKKKNNTSDIKSSNVLKVNFLKDVSPPNNVTVSPDQTIIKTWVVENRKSAWPQGTKLIFLRGDREVSVAEEYDVPLAKGGKEEIEIQAAIITPSKPGTYCAYYSLADENRMPFGPRLWFRFDVQKLSEEEEEDLEESKSEPIVEEKKVDIEDKMSKYEKELNLLRQMGFSTSDEVHLALLDAYNGGIAAVIQDLFKLNPTTFH